MPTVKKVKLLNPFDNVESLFRLDMMIRELYEMKLTQFRPSGDVETEVNEYFMIEALMKDPDSIILAKDTIRDVLREIAYAQNEFYQKSGKTYTSREWQKDSQVYFRVGFPEKYTPSDELNYRAGTDLDNFFATIKNNFEKAQIEPLKISPREWIFKDYLYDVEGAFTDEQFKLLVFEHFDKERQMFEKIKRKISSSDEESKSGIDRRIPENVRVEVWRRDGGKCGRCGSREKLEYDHIVPVSKGGSNTARNVELLCEKCNRSKSDNVA